MNELGSNRPTVMACGSGIGQTPPADLALTPSPHCGNACAVLVSAVRARFSATLAALTARSVKDLGAFA